MAKLSDFLEDYRRLAIDKGESVKGEVIIEILRKEIEDDANNCAPRFEQFERHLLEHRLLRATVFSVEEAFR